MVYPIYNDLSFIKEVKPHFYDINKKTSINFVPMGFDIETSTVYKKDEIGRVIEHFSFMYCWQFSIGFEDDRKVLMGRTWEDFSKLLKEIKKRYCLHGEQTMIFIANQSFEFSFMGKELHKLGHKVEVFARTKRKPMKIIIDDVITFYDTILITGYSLKNMAKNYCKTQKMVGDLDYNLVRLPTTPLTKKETRYCVNDVLPLAEYAEWYEENYLKEKFVPMTKTMSASKVVRDTAKEIKANKEIYFLLKNCYPVDRKDYEFKMSFFSGAYTHGMLANLFVDHYNPKKYDVCSLYPFSMLRFYYPISKFKRLRSKDPEILKNLLNTKCCLLDVTFKNLKTKTGITIISKNKILIDDNDKWKIKNDEYFEWDNGRCWRAKEVRVRITEVDLQLIDMHYDYEEVTYNIVEYANRGKLPKYFALALAQLYKDKCVLKHDESKRIEYNNAKSKLNGQYGALACKLNFTNTVFKDGKWDIDVNDVEFDKMCIRKKTLPQWAIWVTAHSRYVTLSTIKKILDIDPYGFIYSDTDSIVCKNTPEIVKIFDEYNKETRQENQKWIEYYGLDDTIDYAELGTFDDETDPVKGHPIEKFRTLGSKRYLTQYQNGKIETTVAGLPKHSFNRYCSQNHLKPFEVFNDDMLLECAYADKLCAYYCDEEVTKEVTDYRGNTATITSAGYVSLIPTHFKMSVASTLKTLYDRYKEDNYYV